MKTLLLKFAGPLQSWGTDSHFENRYTDFYPSKSAVIGLIAGSLGYKRDQDQLIQKLNDLDFAVRVDQNGKLLRDYQIARRYKNESVERTYVTNRYYLEDAVFIVALGGEDTFIEMIENALKKPYFQQFLGRRSIPPTADFILGTKNENVIDSLKSLAWQAAEWYQRKNIKEENFIDVYFDAKLLDSGKVKYRRDSVASFSQKDRKFNYRAEKSDKIKAVKQIQNADQEVHDAFAALGGSDVSIKS